MKNTFKIIILTFFLLPLLTGCSSDNSTPPTTSEKPDQNPIMLTFLGPSKCQKGQECTFQAKGCDPDGDAVAFHVAYWVTALPHTYTDLGFTEYTSNYELVDVSIIFDSVNEYTLCCYCIDRKQNESSHLQKEVSVKE